MVQMLRLEIQHTQDGVSTFQRYGELTLHPVKSGNRCLWRSHNIGYHLVNTFAIGCTDDPISNREVPRGIAAERSLCCAHYELLGALGLRGQKYYSERGPGMFERLPQYRL